MRAIWLVPDLGSKQIFSVDNWTWCHIPAILTTPFLTFSKLLYLKKKKSWITNKKMPFLADKSANIPEAEIAPPFSYQWNWKHKKNLYFVFWSLISVLCSKCSQLLSPLYVTLFSAGFCLNKGAAQSLGPNIYFAHHKSASKHWWLSSDLITTELTHRVNLVLIVDWILYLTVQPFSFVFYKFYFSFAQVTKDSLHIRQTEIPASNLSHWLSQCCY